MANESEFSQNQFELNVVIDIPPEPLLLYVRIKVRVNMSIHEHGTTCEWLPPFVWFVQF